jgi:hypothetical protein
VVPSAWLMAAATWPVELLDVSMGGLSFLSPYALEIGHTASIRTALGREAFSGGIRVCWTRPPTAGSKPQFTVGAAFLPLDESSRRVLEAFLKLSPPE